MFSAINPTSLCNFCPEEADFKFVYFYKILRPSVILFFLLVQQYVLSKIIKKNVYRRIKVACLLVRLSLCSEIKITFWWLRCLWRTGVLFLCLVKNLIIACMAIIN